MGNYVKKKVLRYVRKYNTDNPFTIAKYLNIQVFFVPLGELSGYYKYIKHHRCIYINSDIEDENYKRLIMAHELGHAILHMKENCYFIKNKTLLSTSKIERDANKFAAELLLNDELINEYRNFTLYQIACCTGVDIKIVELKMEGLA